MRSVIAIILAALATPALAAPEASLAAAIIGRCTSIYKESGHPCACPDDKARNGSRCGKRSAHDKPNGAAPICLATEVTAELEKDFKTNAQAALRERCHYHNR